MFPRIKIIFRLWEYPKYVWARTRQFQTSSSPTILILCRYLLYIWYYITKKTLQQKFLKKTGRGGAFENHPILENAWIPTYQNFTSVSQGTSPPTHTTTPWHRVDQCWIALHASKVDSLSLFFITLGRSPVNNSQHGITRNAGNGISFTSKITQRLVAARPQSQI